MKIKNAMIVFKKDWKEVRRNWQVLLPVMVLPFVISVFLPIVMGTSVSQGTDEGMDELMGMLPSDVQQVLSGLTAGQAAFYVMLLYFFAPFFLIIPLMASSVISSDSFAGEKERKTIESLLETPLTDGELFLGKVLVAFVPSMLITIASFAIYTAVVDFYALQILGFLIMPNLTWVLLIFGLAPAVALLSIGLTVLISAKVRGFREAQQISAILIVPVMALVFGQLSGAITIGTATIAALTGLFAVLDVVVLYVSVKRFNREGILAKI